MKYGKAVTPIVYSGTVTPDIPSDWKILYYAVLASGDNREWTLPAGWYMLHLIGSGGTGGAGSKSGGGGIEPPANVRVYSGGGGGSGACGAYSIYRVYFQNTTAIKVSKTGNTTTLTFTDTIARTIQVTDGFNGSSSTDGGRPPAGGAGGRIGTASGGNLVNNRGTSNAGTAGKVSEYSPNQTISGTVYGSQGGISAVTSLKYQQNSTISTPTPELFNFGIGGAGGQGGNTRYEIIHYEGTNITPENGQAGKPGTLGGIVIEIPA